MILTDEDMLEELMQVKEYLMLPVISSSSGKATSYYDYIKSHERKLLTEDLLREKTMIKVVSKIEPKNIKKSEQSDLRAELFARAFLMPRENFEKSLANSMTKDEKFDLEAVAFVFSLHLSPISIESY